MGNELNTNVSIFLSSSRELYVKSQQKDLPYWDWQKQWILNKTTALRLDMFEDLILITSSLKHLNRCLNLLWIHHTHTAVTTEPLNKTTKARPDSQNCPWVVINRFLYIRGEQSYILYFPLQSQPVTAMVRWRCFPELSGKNLNSSIAPTHLFIL